MEVVRPGRGGEGVIATPPPLVPEPWTARHQNAKTTRHSRMLMIERLAAGWSVKDQANNWPLDRYIDTGDLAALKDTIQLYDQANAGSTADAVLGAKFADQPGVTSRPTTSSSFKSQLCWFVARH